ncbi:MAG: PTS glucose transporter subunit IIA, partial [Erysipelotrichaceae bacterium]|nr:PTS glucose transporter subunit IIA [Erysipelotrichaceae bacterium]
MYIYEGNQLLFYFLTSIFSVAMCCILTMLFGIPKEAMIPDDVKETKSSFIAPASGKVMALEEVEDEVFAKKTLGDGFAITLNDGKIIAPFSGQLVSVFPSGHAYGIKGDNGEEILIHIGVDTASLQGEGFCMHVKQGEHVKQGDVLVDVDIEKLQSLHKSLATMIIFTNGKEVTIDKSIAFVQCGQSLDI